NAQFSNNLTAVLNEIKKEPKAVEGMEAKLGAVPDRGWVVEIRGYTYHRDRYKFVMETLVKPLARRSAAKQVEKTGKEAEKKPAAAPAQTKDKKDRSDKDKKEKDKNDKDADKKESEEAKEQDQSVRIPTYEEMFPKVISERISHITVYASSFNPDPAYPIL